MRATCTARAPIRSISAPTVDRADDRPQVSCDRLLQGEQFERTALGRLSCPGLLMVGDDLFGHGKATYYEG